MTKKVIGQVLHGLNVGGAEVLAARLARQLVGLYRFVFICLDELGTLGEDLLRDGFPVHVLCRQRGLDWRCARRMAELFRQEKVDLVHAHQYTPFFYGITARFLWRRSPVLFTEHGRWFPDYPRTKRIVANRLLLERRDRVVGVGEAVRQALIVNEGIPIERVSVIYNGIDVSTFEGPDHRETVREELGLGRDDLVVTLVARLDPLKDHPTAIRTLQHVVRRNANARLVLVGDGPERDSIRALVREHRLDEHVHLIGQRSDVARLLSAADIALLTSVSEGIPLTLIEAMAAGLPVISTRVGGVVEIVEEGRTGLLAPVGDDATLARLVDTLANDANLRNRMGQLGRERARELFSERQMHARYLRLYREMLRA